MKPSDKASRKRRTKRDLFSELKEGMEALADARDGKRPLRIRSIELKVASSVTTKK